MRRLTSLRWLLVLCLAATGTAFARDLPNFDITSQRKPSVRKAPASSMAIGLPGRVVHRDEVTGMPTFIWAAPGKQQAASSALAGKTLPADVAARNHLSDYAAHYGLTASDINGLEVRHIHDTGKGAIVVQFQQRIGSLEVWRDHLSVVMARDRSLVALSGSLEVLGTSPLAVANDFKLHGADAVTAAYRDLTGASGASLTATGKLRGDYQYFQLASANAPESLRSPARARPVAFRGLKGLEAAYYLELDTREVATGAAHGYAYVVSARTGKVLVRTNLVNADAYSYRVFADSTGQMRPFDGPRGNDVSPHPTGVPDGFEPAFVAPNLVTLANGPISTNDPWLPPGATETRGNNVDAYADLIEGDGFTPTNPDGGVPDFRAATTAPGTFDYTYDLNVTAEANTTQMNAGITNLFYITNWLHDWYYDVGFDEAAGNAQQSNLGRTSDDFAQDVLLAEAEDFSGTDNANMFTPADGASPRMQMYIFGGRSDIRLTVNTPPAIAGNYQVGTAQFGPVGFNVTGDLVLVNDGVGVGSDGCTPFAGVTGQVALIDRGTCSFLSKVQNAQAAGAIAVVIANNADTIVNMAGVDPTITIPTVSISLSNANTIKAQLGGGVNVTLFSQDPATVINLDGSLDNTVIAHEWGHYIAHRLVGAGNGFNAKITNSMGEGWSDFHAMLLIVRPEDAAAPAGANFSGTYALGVYDTFGLVQDNAYFAIRRYPYSTNMAKNPLTFQNIKAGVPLPVGPPVSLVVAGTDNTEVHAAGEVWASMLWECYAALLNARAFDDAQPRMQRYLVSAYKATPPNPTFTEARDALLAVVGAEDSGDFQLFGQAFAKRGLGTGAIAPDRFDPTNGATPASGSVLVESFAWGKDLYLANLTFSDDVVSCDSDGVLDANETGSIQLTLQNTGSDPLTATTVNVTSPTAGITIPDGGVFGVPAIDPGKTATVIVPVSLDNSVTGISTMDLSIAVTDPDVDAGVLANRILSAAGTLRINTDDLPASSATDSVEASSTVWTTVSAPHLWGSFQFPWQRVEFDATHHEWFAIDPESGVATSDESLVSPALQISATDPFIVTFQARWDEEADTTGDFFDGVVVEISDDNGTTWTDVKTAGGTLTPDYNGTIYDDPINFPDPFRNPLHGRSAFVSTNPASPDFDTVTLDFGTTQAGKTVQIRFRAGSDSNGFATGFELDDIGFAGIAGTPFPTLVADRQQCKPTVSAGPDQSVNERATATLAGTVSQALGTPTILWTQTAGPAVTLSNAAVASPTFTAPEVTADTVLTFQISAVGLQGSANDTVDVTVHDVNRPPVAVITGPTTAQTGATVSLSGSGSSDPDGDAITYLWAQTSGTSVTISGASTAAASFVAPAAAATVVIQLTVTDAKGLSSTASQTVTVSQPSSGCGCNQTTGAPSAVVALAVLGLWIVRRRRTAV